MSDNVCVEAVACWQAGAPPERLPRKEELEAVIPFRVPNVSCSAQPGGAPVSLSPENRSLHSHPPPFHLPRFPDEPQQVKESILLLSS